MIRAMTVKAATAFSGIGAPECALPGWDWRWSAEIEPFPAAVLAARHPGSINLGDVLAAGFDERAKSLGPIDVLVGGPPCQAFSVAGDRNSLADARGNLSLRWAEIIHAVDPVLAVTENVPGWLNTPDDAFGHFLGALVGADGPLPAPGGSGWPRAGMVAGPLARACWRVLDAQYFGVAQRRERVFVVSSAGDRVDPSQILFESKSLRRHPPSRGETGERIARPLAACSPGGSGYRNDADTADNLNATALTTKYGESSGRDFETAGSLVARDSAKGIDSDCTDTLIPVAYGGNDTRGPIEVSTALNAHGGPHGRLDFESETFVWQTGGDFRLGLGPITSALQREQTPAIWQSGSNQDQLVAQEPVAYQCQGSNVGEAGTLRSGNGHLTGGVPFVAAFDARQSDVCQYGDIAAPLDTDGHSMMGVDLRNGVETGTVAQTLQSHHKSNSLNAEPTVRSGAAIRRLTPTECERLQGFPDGWTAITYRGKEAADGNRYKACGNAMAVPCIRWLLARIEERFRA